MYILEFSCWWPQVRSILWPPHYKAMGEKSKPSFWHHSCSACTQSSCFRLFLMTQFVILTSDPRKGQMRSPEVTHSFLLITFDRKEIKTCKWSHRVRLVKALRLICSMTYFGHQVTLRSRDLRSNIDLDLSRSSCIWFDASWRDKHDGAWIIALALLVKKLLPKNRIPDLTFHDLWWPQYWPERKIHRSSFVMIFDELSNAVFRFSLRPLGAEIEGGCSTTPPPAGRGKSRGPAGRGLRLHSS